MDFKELVKKNRSYRSSDESVRISEEELKGFVDVARYAASSINRQTLKFRLVYTEEEVAIVRPLTKWAAGLPGMQIPPLGHHAAAFIVICEDMGISTVEKSYLKDTGICAQTIMLAAVEAGYGGCMIGNFRPEEVSKALQIPEGIVPQLILALGKPDEEITIVPAGKDGNVKYYRDEAGRHYVPKRALEDILL